MPDLAACLEVVAALHPRLCPRQVLGVRMGLYAADLLELELPCADKRVLTFVETDGCFADGVAVATGCWLGRRTMRLMDVGRVAATFVDTATERAFRVRPHPRARHHARQYAPAASTRWHAYLTGYQVMPVEELLQAAPVEITLSIADLVSRPGLRASCDICGEEVLNAREVRRGGQVLCPICAADVCYYAEAQSALKVASAPRRA